MNKNISFSIEWLCNPLYIMHSISIKLHSSPGTIIIDVAELRIYFEFDKSFHPTQ